MNSTKTKNTFLSPTNTANPQHFPSISKPKIIGAYSLDGQCKYVSDRRSCRYLYKNYHSEPVQYDLNKGMESVIRSEETCIEEAGSMDDLLHFILENIEISKQNDEDPNTKFLSADVVCYRGLLQLLMITPYEHHESWIILATNYKGTLYLTSEETDEQTEEVENRTETDKAILSYGFKFEQFLLSGKMHLNK